MLKRLFGLRGDDTTRREESYGELFSRFKGDYIESGLLDTFPESVKIECLAGCATDGIKDESDALSVFCAIRIIHIAKTLISEDYLKPLALKFQQLTYVDEYGDLNCDDWDRELAKFVNKRSHKFWLEYQIDKFYLDAANKMIYNGYSLINSLIHYGDSASEKNEEIVSDIYSVVASYLSDLERVASRDTIGNSTLDTINDPYEYEHVIAELLNAHGWQARATSGSGDQGVDVVATFNDTTLVIQCKLYSQPVGNKAVQEVHAGLGFMRATHAAVVTNSSYTKSARQLAQQLGVILIHHDQLQELSKTLLGGNFIVAEPCGDDEFQDNQCFITKIISDELTSNGLDTHFEEGDYSPEDSLLGVWAGDAYFVFYCTDYLRPITAVEMNHIIQTIDGLSNVTASFITATHGATTDALGLLDNIEGTFLIANSDIEHIHTTLLDD